MTTRTKKVSKPAPTTTALYAMYADTIKTLRSEDETVAVFDAALNAAEDHLRTFFFKRCHDCLDRPGRNGVGRICKTCHGKGETLANVDYSAGAIAEAFKEHINTHLWDELYNIKTHGHRNDDPADIPS